MAGYMICQEITCLPFFPRSQEPTATHNPYTGSTDQAPAISRTGLDISYQDSAVQEYIKQDLAPPSQRTYKAALKRFHKLYETCSM